MKKFMYVFALPLLLAAFSGCDKGEDPQELPFTEYSLIGTGSNWDYFAFGTLGNPVVALINSDEELKPYIDGTDYPAIDFSKHTLVLAGGLAGMSVSLKTVRLLELSTDKYLLDVELNWSDATTIGRWRAAILVEKMSSETKVELEIK